MHNVLRVIVLAGLLLGLVTLVTAQSAEVFIAACTDADDRAAFSITVTADTRGTLQITHGQAINAPGDNLPEGAHRFAVTFDADGLAGVAYALDGGASYALVIRQGDYYCGSIVVGLDPVAGTPAPLLGDAPAIPVPVSGPGAYAIWFPDDFGTLTDSGVVVTAELKDGAWVAVIVLGDRSLVGRSFEARQVR